MRTLHRQAKNEAGPSTSSIQQPHAQDALLNGHFDHYWSSVRED